MFMRKALLLGSALLIAANAADADEGPGLGQGLTGQELAAIDYTVMPDGDGLPQGSGNALAGRAVYTRVCLACHGENGSGGLNDALVGGHGTLTGPAPQKTVGSYWPYATTIFDYVRRAMPFQAPGSLSNDDIYAVTAYLLFANDIIDGDDVMDAQTLPRVKMPNRDNFVWAVTPE